MRLPEMLEHTCGVSSTPAKMPPSTHSFWATWAPSRPPVPVPSPHPGADLAHSGATLPRPRPPQVSYGTIIVAYETDQMRSRVTYLLFSHSLMQGDESTAVDCGVCRSCAARLYLEGHEQAPRRGADVAEARDRSRSRSTSP